MRMELHHIHVFDEIDDDAENRERKADLEHVAALVDSIRRHGLQTPIRALALGGLKYRLVAGLHRLEAYRELARTDSKYLRIPASLVPFASEKDATKAAEIVENLIRAELSPDERERQTALYVALLKRGGEVIDAKAKMAEAGRQAHLDICPAGAAAMPTAMQKAAKDLGVSTRTIRRRVIATAERAGMGRMTPETATADQLEEAAQKAQHAPKPIEVEPPRKAETTRERPVPCEPEPAADLVAENAALRGQVAELRQTVADLESVIRDRDVEIARLKSPKVETRPEPELPPGMKRGRFRPQ